MFLALCSPPSSDRIPELSVFLQIGDQSKSDVEHGTEQIEDAPLINSLKCRYLSHKMK